MSDLLNSAKLQISDKHNTFHNEAITGKAGGFASGANIDYATNAVTLQVQKTLPKILNDLGRTFVGTFAAGFTYTSNTDYATDSVGTQWSYSGTASYPVIVTAGTVPSAPNYTAINVTDHNQLTNKNAAGAHDASSINLESGGNVESFSVAVGYKSTLTVGSLTPPFPSSNSVYVNVAGEAGHYELYASGGSQENQPITSIAKRDSGLVVINTALGSYYALDYGKTTQEKFKLYGDLTSIADVSFELNLAKYYQIDYGFRDLPMPIETQLNLIETITNTGDIIIHGNVTINSSNPQNRYLVTPSDYGILFDISRIGNLSRFATAIKRNMYGGRRPVVVFVGDSLFMGGHNYTDYNWPAKQIENEILNAVPTAWCFNRAIAGSVVSELFSPIPAYVTNPATVHAPGEAPWIVDTGRTWLSYITELDPDLIVVGFGMNDYGYSLAGYNEMLTQFNLLNSDTIMVSTPMRSTDPATPMDLGTFPNNEFSNSAGRAVRKFSTKNNLTLIDANKMSNFVMNGVNVDNIRFKDLKINEVISTSGATTSEAGGVISATIPSGGTVGSAYPGNGFAVTFTPTAISGYLYVAGGRGAGFADGAGVFIEVTDSYIKLYLPNESNTASVLYSTHTISTIGQEIRFQYDGEFVQLTIFDVYLERSIFVLGANAQDSFSIASSGGSSSISNLKMQKVEPLRSRKLLTTNEIFSGIYGDGGNGINHLTQIGSREIYQPAINDFGNKLLKELKVNNQILSYDQIVWVAEANTYASMGEVVRDENVANINIYKLQGTFTANAVIGQVGVLAIPNSQLVMDLINPSTNATIKITVKSNGDIVTLSAINSGDGLYVGSFSFIRSN